MSGSESDKKLTRRQMLVSASKLTAAAAMAPILAACGATATPTKAPAAAATAAPGAATKAPTVAATPAARKPVKLVMANYGAIPDAWKTLGTKFTAEYPWITVEFEGIQANVWGEYFDKLVTEIAAGTPPDISRVAIEGVQLFASRNLALPLDDYINKDKAELTEYFADINPQMYKYMGYKGKQYQLPFTWNGPVIYYNKKMFQDAGIARPKDDWTQQEFLEIALKLTKGDVFGFGFANAYWGSAIPWLFVNDTDLLNDDWSQSIADSPKTVEAIQFLQDLIWKYKVSPKPAGYDFNAAFISGKIAMGGFTGGNGRLTFINGGFSDFDVLYFPKWKAQTHEFGGTGFPIINGTKNPEEAWLLTKFLVRKESITEFVNAVAQTPGRRSVALSGWVKPGSPPEHFTIYWEMLNKPSKAVPAPPEYNETESIFLRYLTLVTANERTAQQAMTDCHKELNALYAKRKV